MSSIRLGINVDHVATVRNARGGAHPDPLRAAEVAVAAGADGITAHLREDRRHITDADIDRLMAELTVPLNLEMAATDEMLAIAIRHRPHAVCIVPERRSERTTESGLDAAGQADRLRRYVEELSAAGVRVSLFIDPEAAQVEAAHRLAAPVVELHTGAFCEATGDAAARELARLTAAAERCAEFGIECHAGHGIDYRTVADVAALPGVRELNIGHFLIGEAVFVGLAASVRQMRDLIDAAVA